MLIVFLSHGMIESDEEEQECLEQLQQYLLCISHAEGRAELYGIDMRSL